MKEQYLLKITNKNTNHSSYRTYKTFKTANKAFKELCDAPDLTVELYEKISIGGNRVRVHLDLDELPF